MATDGLLAGLRVVEIGQFIAAPFAATTLADLGADVVKVERPGGDPYRRDAARFAAWNRGKQSVELDLSTSTGRAAVLHHLDGADVLVENLRPGTLARLGLPLDELRAEQPQLVTCSISAYGSTGPSRDDPGWEPLVHARAGAQQGLFTGDEPLWLPFPMASIAASMLAVIGVGAALVKRESTGYGQHVETSLLDGLLFLNAGAIFHRPRHRPLVVRNDYNPVLHTYETSDGYGIQINLSGTARWREVCKLVGLDDDGGLDFADPMSLVKLADREWCRKMIADIGERFARRTAAEWEAALLEMPAPVAVCNRLEDWLAHEQTRANRLLASTDDPSLGDTQLVASPVRVHANGHDTPRMPRHGGQGGALAGHRVVDTSSFWAGPLAARLLSELGADVIKVEPPGGEGAYQLAAILPNIYMDGNRSKRGLTLDLRDDEDRRRFLDLVAAADVVVENAVVGTWERLELDEAALRAVNPRLVYARVKGFGLEGPLASRPSFDFVVQAATGMITAQGGGRPQPMNFTANDYCTGLHLAAGVVLALLARARGTAVTSVDTSLMASATLFQSEMVAALAIDGTTGDVVGSDLRGPAPGRRLYRAADGWIVVCAVTARHDAALAQLFGGTEPDGELLERAISSLSVDDALARLGKVGVPAARSVHPCHVPDDEQVRARGLMTEVRHRTAGPYVQVGIPLSLSVDVPAVKGPAPSPKPYRAAKAS